MTNSHGSFIWYELLTSDPDAAAAFYGDVIGWTSKSAEQPGVDYRFFYAGDEGIGGHMKLPREAEEAGAKPGWIGYIGVDDVDATVASILEAGGSVPMPAMDLEGVGRMAMVRDPQGVPFYVMRGFSDQPSHSFDPSRIGHCSWNELSTPDQAGALAFYTALFGWTKGDAMPMGDMGDYQFIEQDGEMFGAVMTNPPGGQRPSWKFAFNVADIEVAAERIAAGGGTVISGPMEVPGGDMVVVASDPQGAPFMAVRKHN